VQSKFPTYFTPPNQREEEKWMKILTVFGPRKDKSARSSQLSELETVLDEEENPLFGALASSGIVIRVFR
jgi:hypothetical protein